MSETRLRRGAFRASMETMAKWTSIVLIVAAGGCVNVTAPDKPIVINLNIAITQEVVYRLDGQAKDVINANPGIFG